MFILKGNGLPYNRLVENLIIQYSTYTEMIEKPEVDKSPSNLAFAGRYILTPEIFQALEDTPPGKNNEVQLTDAMIRMGKFQSIYAYKIEGKRFDIGNKLDYLKTMIEFALKRKEFENDLMEFLKGIVKKQ